MQLNTRSVLRPEYLNYATTDYSLYNTFYSEKNSKPRVNTNTAPVFSTHDDVTPKRKIAQRKNHSYYQSPRYDHLSPTLKSDSNMKNSSINEKDSFHNDLPQSKDSYIPVLSHSVRNSPEDGSSRNEINFRRISPSLSRMYSHGQSEQLRRSRESTTFALIDDQLSKPPLCQVRDMYLQSRLGINSTGYTSTRTTKKANLSAVHTVVRFRIKEYIMPMISHMRRMLDVLFSSLYPDYDPNIREALSIQLFGQSHLPCSLSCEFCERFRYQLSRQLPSRKVFSGRSQSEHLSSPLNNSLHNSDSLAPHLPETLCSDSASRIPKFAPLNFQKMRNSPTTTPPSSPSPFFNSDTHEPTSDVDLVDELKDFVDEVNTQSFPEDIIGRISASETKSLSPRKRLDSLSVRLLESFDLETMYWSSSNMEFGCSNDSTNLSDLIMDLNSETKLNFLPCEVSPLRIFEETDTPLKRSAPHVPSSTKIRKFSPSNSCSSNYSNSSSSSSFTSRRSC